MAGRNLIVASNPKRRTSAAQRAAARRNIKKAQAARKRKSPKRRTRARAVTRRRKAPARRRTAAKRRTYRNPVRLIPKNLVERQLMPALIGGGGAVLNDAAYSLVMTRLAGMLPGGLGLQLTTGPGRHVGKAASALLMTFLASYAVNRRTAETMGAGALTVIGYNIVRELAERFAPQIPLGAYLDPGLSYAGAGVSPSGRLNPRTGSDLGLRSGLAAYVRPNGRRSRGLSAVPQLSQRGQLTQLDPFTPANQSSEGYHDYE